MNNVVCCGKTKTKKTKKNKKIMYNFILSDSRGIEAALYNSITYTQKHLTVSQDY